jgi:hypothetical protein
MNEHEKKLPDYVADESDAALIGESALADWNREGEDAAWAHLHQPSPDAVTPMLDQAMRAAKALPESDQDALAAAILEWIEDERRWSESFARTHEALAELAREALAEHHAGESVDAAYSEMALDEEREAADWAESWVADAADEDE